MINDMNVQLFDVKVVLNCNILKQLESLQYDNNSFINNLIADCDKISRTLRVERHNLDISHEDIFGFVDTLDVICDILKEFRKTEERKDLSNEKAPES